VEPGVFRVFPYENPDLEPFEAAVRTLSPEVAVKVRSAAVHTTFNVMCVLPVLTSHMGPTFTNVIFTQQGPRGQIHCDRC
jgi:hypothetical protein